MPMVACLFQYFHWQAGWLAAWLWVFIDFFCLNVGFFVELLSRCIPTAAGIPDITDAVHSDQCDQHHTWCLPDPIPLTRQQKGQATSDKNILLLLQKVIAYWSFFPYLLILAQNIEWIKNTILPINTWFILKTKLNFVLYLISRIVKMCLHQSKRIKVPPEIKYC